MSLKGLSERFEQKMDSLYGKYSARTNGSSQPFLEIKPNDPNKNDTAFDSQFSPNESYKRDLKRIGSFLKSPGGIKFMLSQAELQSGNTFSETRIFNPLFPLGPIQPGYVRLTRPLGKASGLNTSSGNPSSIVKSAIGSIVTGLVQGDSALSSERSPGADTLVGSAGRLQRATAVSTVNKVLSRSGPTGLLNLLPASKITRIASAVGSVLQTGILNVNERPELNFDGEYFSIAMWSGFTRSKPQTNNFAKAGVDLRKGNLKSAVTSLSKGVVDELKKRTVGTVGAPIPTAPRQGRNDPYRTDLNGLRYFIVNTKDVDRYLNNSVVDGHPNVGYLDRLPYQLQGKGVSVESEIDTPTSSKKLIASAQQKINQLDSKKKNVLSKIGGFVKGTTKVLFGGAFDGNRLNIGGVSINLAATSQITGRLKTGSLTNNSVSQNPAEQNLLFGELALANQYDSATGDVKFFKEELETQKSEWGQGLRQLKLNPTYGLGYLGGLQPGNPIVDDDGVFISKRTKVDDGRYFHDGAIKIDAILANKDDGTQRSVHADLKNQIRDAYHDSIDFIFHDYVNNRVIPFRSIFSQISENVNAEFNSQPYIGRTERNIVYSGASRELMFTFHIQAFSQDELDFIWQKVNYLTGLCFPSVYANGFMVPPFVQLTIGQLYVDQPGYLRSLTYTIEDGTSWDIKRDKQIPMGITCNAAFSVIEKGQAGTGYQFYGFGEPKPVDK
jgi:hypothetical protein